jgi:hypothetical protein
MKTIRNPFVLIGRLFLFLYAVAKSFLGDLWNDNGQIGPPD